MNTFFYITLFLFWTLFGSFASVVIYRLKLNEKWIIFWRSHCSNCNTTLEALQLIPIFSRIINKWKCKYCKKKVSHIYPILETSMWLLFSLIGYFLIDFSLILSLDLVEIIKLFFWLFVAFITIIYTFYDILFLEVHEWVMLSSIVVSFLVLSLQSFWVEIIDFLPVWNDFSLAISSIFIVATVLVWLYIIMLKWLHEIWDIIILSACFFIAIFLWDSNITIINSIIWALIIFSFFFFQIVLSGWKWMWWWDLRIAILIWMILWASLSLPATFITYLVWSIIWILFIIKWKVKNWLKSKLNTKIPFGPFLAIWFFITIFYRKEVTKFIEVYF